MESLETRVLMAANPLDSPAIATVGSPPLGNQTSLVGSPVAGQPIQRDDGQSCQVFALDAVSASASGAIGGTDSKAGLSPQTHNTPVSAFAANAQSVPTGNYATKLQQATASAVLPITGGDSKAKATDLGVIFPGDPMVYEVYVNKGHRNDWFKFQAGASSTYITAQDNFHQGARSKGFTFEVWDGSTRLGKLPNGSNQQLGMNLTLIPGKQYYIHLKALSAKVTGYQLGISVAGAPVESPGDGPGTAIPLGYIDLSGGKSFFTQVTVDAGHPHDWLSFTVNISKVNIFATDSLHQAARVNGFSFEIWDDNTRLDWLPKSTNQDLGFSRTLIPGKQYLLHLTATSPNVTDYQIIMGAQ